MGRQEDILGKPRFETEPAGRVPSRRAARENGLPWWLLSRISPARRVALTAVAVFEVVEVALLSGKGIEERNWIPLLLGFVILLLLMGFEVAEHARAKRDNELAHEISEWLLPHSAPSVGGVEIAFCNRMANHVGSDYYNVFPRWMNQTSKGPCLFIVMADVAGSGLQGALLMATFQASLRVLVDSKLALSELASHMNLWSWDRSLEGRHFTMAFLADFDPLTGSLQYVSAGHQPPVICRGGGGTERLELRGFPFGALPDASYEMGSAILAPGDTLVVFTDGVVKAENRRREQFGEDRLVRVLALARTDTATEMVNNLSNSLLSFCGSSRQPDDLSFLVVRKSSAQDGR